MMWRNKKIRVLIVMAISIFLFQGCGKTVLSDIKDKKEQIYDETRQNMETEEKVVVPEQPEFILGSGDTLEISVYRNNDLKQTVTISPSGKFMFPLLGDVQAAGLSVFKLRDNIHDGLRPFIVDPQVSVNIVSSYSRKIIVLGEVANPGFFQTGTNMTVIEAISLAGGFTENGKQNNVLLIRGGLQNSKLIKLNLIKALKKGDLSQNLLVEKGDIIYVPRHFIANVNRFFTTFSNVISPFVALETGYFINQQIRGTRGATNTAPN